MASLSYSAVLLAAGQSSRMGQDKALLPVGDLPLWRRQWAVLARTGVAQLKLSVRPEQSWVPAGVPVVHDRQAEAGPLAGIAAALTGLTTTHLLVLAVDLPRMEAAWFTGLMQHCDPGVGAVGRHADYFEPLAAIYPRELSDAAEAALAGGDRSLQHFIALAGDRMRHHEITPAEAHWFANWNEPAT